MKNKNVFIVLGVLLVPVVLTLSLVQAGILPPTLHGMWAAKVDEVTVQHDNLVIQSARLKAEANGSHWNIDYIWDDNSWCADISSQVFHIAHCERSLSEAVDEAIAYHHKQMTQKTGIETVAEGH